MIDVPMYGTLPDTATLIGWILLGVVVVLAAARAVRFETRVAWDRAPRGADRALDVSLAVAVVALLGALVAMVLAVL